jgi:1,4-alpha-glucan branching enzyme
METGMLKKRFFKTKNECEVAFEVQAEDAEQVDLLCESNDWEPIPMKKNRNGAFRAKVRLPEDRRFEFRYLVDGRTWLTDETADAVRPNRFGSTNSVLDTTRAR